VPEIEREPIAITNADDPRVGAYRGLTDADLRRSREAAEGLFIAEGSLVVRELIASRFATRSVLLLERCVEELSDALARLPAVVPIYAASPGVMDAIAGFHIHRGILAAGTRREPIDPRDLIERSRVLVILEDLTNHDNVGGIFRVAAALGGERVGVILSPRCCDPLYRKSLRVSIGHALRVPYATAQLDGAFFAGLASAGLSIAALTPGADATPIRDFAAREPSTHELSTHGRSGLNRVALALGSEGPGLRGETLAAIDAAGGDRVRIPMTPGVDSLNVTTAAAVALSHLVIPDGSSA
jgi:tRNA G18 (ribose-2'-O)-methylase SpoU